MTEKFNRILKNISGRFFIVRSLLRFLWENKLWWMIPLILVLIVFFAIIIFAQSSPLGPFIYTIF